MAESKARLQRGQREGEGDEKLTAKRAHHLSEAIFVKVKVRLSIVFDYCDAL